jgi:tRNA(adenine34) deaminase
VNDLDYMQEALLQAVLSEEKGEVPVGAIVVVDNKIIARAHNQAITHHDPSAHAEILALRAAGKALNNYRMPKATLYVTLEPCLMCATAMIHARLQRLVFGAYDARAGAACSVFHSLTGKAKNKDAPFNHAIPYEGGILKNKSENLLGEFFKKRR